MRIGVFISGREDMAVLARIYELMSRRFKVYLYDVSPETGWFEKGIQYISLGYEKASPTYRYGMRDEDIEREMVKISEEDGLDYILFYGSRAAVLPFIYYAWKSSIPIIHIGSGLRSYMYTHNESIRQLVDYLSSIHITIRNIHTVNLSSEGYPSEKIYEYGYPLIDTLESIFPRAISRSTILDEMGVDEGEYVSIYIDLEESIRHINELIEFSDKTNEFIILPLSRRLKRLLMEDDKYYSLMERHDVLFMELFDYIDHLAFLYYSKSVITDDEWIYIESLILGKPGILFRVDEPPLILPSEANVVRVSRNMSRLIASKYLHRPNINVRGILGGRGVSESIINHINRVDIERPNMVFPGLRIRDGDRIRIIPKGEIDIYRRYVV